MKVYLEISNIKNENRNKIEKDIYSLIKKYKITDYNLRYGRKESIKKYFDNIEDLLIYKEPGDIVFFQSNNKWLLYKPKGW